MIIMGTPPERFLDAMIEAQKGNAEDRFLNIFMEYQRCREYYNSFNEFLKDFREAFEEWCRYFADDKWPQK